MKTKILWYFQFLWKYFLSGFIFALWIIAAVLGVNAFQNMTTQPWDTGNQSLSSPLLSKDGWTFERDTMSLQAISESLWIKKIDKRIFVTNASWNWNLWWLSWADAKCQAAADAAWSVSSVKWKKWMALLWDSNLSLKWRIPYLHARFIDPNGTMIFENNTKINYFLRPEHGFPATFNGNGLMSTLLTITELWTSVSSYQTWSASLTSWDIRLYNANDRTYNNCANWTTNTSSATYYASYWYVHPSYLWAMNWLYHGNADCSSSYKLICIEI
jgi:hypothetical protein